MRVALEKENGGLVYRLTNTVALKGICHLWALLSSQPTRFVRQRLMWVLLMVLVASVITPLGPFALKLIIDGFTENKPALSLGIGLLIALYVFCQWVAKALQDVRWLMFSRVEKRLMSSVSEQLFAHVMHLPLRYHLQRSTGAINQTLENGLSGIRLILFHLCFTLLPIGVHLVATGWILFSLGKPVFLLIFCAAVICYGTAFWYFVAHGQKSSERASAAAVRSTALMTDNILAYEIVKYFTAESRVRAQVREALGETEQLWAQFHRGNAVYGLIVATISAGFLALTIGLAAAEVSKGGMTIGEFVLINTYMWQVMQPVELLGDAARSFSQGTAMLEKMLELLRERPEADVVPSEANPARPNLSSLEFRGVGFAYQPGRPVLRNVDFAVTRGRTLGICGPSGAGKSTILRLLLRLIEQDSGEILLDGVASRGWTLADLRSLVAVVPQDTILFNQSIGYNIAFGRPHCSQAEIEEVARLTCLHDLIMSWPEQYNTVVGERGIMLSGGEKQRVSLARAALRRPSVYVFDEATSSLDSLTEQQILGSIREISRDCISLVIAHRLSTVVHADEIVLLDGGAIRERGSHAQLIALDGNYARLWRAQQHEHKSPVGNTVAGAASLRCVPMG
jgi:ATP-binding cassette subfamily B protein